MGPDIFDNINRFRIKWLTGYFYQRKLLISFRLVDDVASHVRLFKKARHALRTRNKEDGKIVDLVLHSSIFNYA